MEENQQTHGWRGSGKRKRAAVSCVIRQVFFRSNESFVVCSFGSELTAQLALRIVIDCCVKLYAMLRQSLRKLSFTAYQAAEVASKVDMSNPYVIQLAKAQRHVNGFVGGQANSKIRRVSIQLKSF